ncbi:HAD family hydrolase [Ramlibacter sp.]|uniref:HAD family hydrolase n=1 Tax=Ramlibacter sp. TaxID=1917967 RepID=UPI003D1014FD
MDASAFILDMDGTMVDSMPSHADSWAEFARRHGVRMPVEEILKRTTGRNGVECIRELFGADVSEERALQLIGEKEAIYREIFAPVFREVAGLREFVADAQARGLRIAVATAGDRGNIEFTLSRLKLAQAPEVVIGGDEGLPGKPDPALFLESARRLGMAPAQCIVFEDAPFGIEAARRAGMRAVAICTTHSPDALRGDHVIAQARDFHELTHKNLMETRHA